MAFGDPTNPTSKYAGLGDRQAVHPTIILRQSFNNGQIKVYSDAKGLAEKTEIGLPEGTVVISKDYDKVETLVHYKKIEVFTPDGTFRTGIDIMAEDRNMPHPAYRFYYGSSMIGRGYGDISMEIAQKLSTENLGAKISAHTVVDDEVITTIKDLLKSKAI